MGPVVIAKALENTACHASLTVGTTAQKSPYDILAISQGMETLGAKSVMPTKTEIVIDEHLKIITAPCYMMEATIQDIFEDVQQAIKTLFTFL